MNRTAIFVIVLLLIVGSAIYYHFVYLPSEAAKSVAQAAANDSVSTPTNVAINVLPVNQEALFNETFDKAVIDFKLNDPYYINATDVNKALLDSIITNIKDNPIDHKKIFDQAIASNMNLDQAIYAYIKSVHNPSVKAGR